MVDKLKELFEELKILRKPLLHCLEENKKNKEISGETIFLSKKGLINLLNISNKYNSELNIWYTNKSEDDFDRLTISFWFKDKKKDNPLTNKLIEMLEESGTKVVDVTPKTIEEKRLEKIRETYYKKRI